MPTSRAYPKLFLFTIVGAALAAGAWNPACDETRSGTYKFEALGGSQQRPVRISLCADVTCAKKSDVTTVSEDTYSLPAPSGPSRPYFLIEREGEKRVIGARRIALAGAFNFRDLGGLETTDGKRIRWGKVFRSDTLTHLTASDYQRLNALGISLVCDLRTRDERKSDPTEWKDGNPVVVLAAVSEDAKGASQNGGLMEGLTSGKLTLEKAQDLFEAFYVRIAFDSAYKLGTVLRAIETSNAPSLFHCTGGRDRTGITAALLEKILGIPNQAIDSDYVLSTQYLNEGGASYAPPNATPEKIRLFQQVIELRPRYIHAIFQAIDQKYGSFDRYRREALRLTDADVSALKTALLE